MANVEIKRVIKGADVLLRGRHSSTFNSLRGPRPRVLQEPGGQTALRSPVREAVEDPGGQRVVEEPEGPLMQGAASRPRVLVEGTFIVDFSIFAHIFTDRNSEGVSK